MLILTRRIGETIVIGNNIAKTHASVWNFWGRENAVRRSISRRRHFAYSN